MISVRRIQTGEGELFKRMRLTALYELPSAFASTYEALLRHSNPYSQGLGQHMLPNEALQRDVAAPSSQTCNVDGLGYTHTMSLRKDSG